MTANDWLFMFQSIQGVLVCSKLKGIPVAKRRDFFKEHKFCFNCLSNTYMIKACKSNHHYIVDTIVTSDILIVLL